LKLTKEAQKRICLHEIQNAMSVLDDFRLVCSGCFERLPFSSLRPLVGAAHQAISLIDQAKIPRKEKAGLLQSKKRPRSCNK
jgi:hypothetical protein